jgi:hypothetical protein
MVMKKACDELEFRFQRCKSDTRAVLKEEGVTSPPSRGRNHFFILLYKTDTQKYRILIEEMDHNMLQRKDPFQNLSLMCAECWPAGKISVSTRATSFLRHMMASISEKCAIRYYSDFIGLFP